MKKVLFITYYWPPSGKASIHWPLKIIKYLPENNWQPSVLTVKEEGFAHTDASMLREVATGLPIYKTEALEPFTLYRKLLGKPADEPLVASETISTENRGIAHRLSVWVRMNLFLPDARIGWYPYAVAEGLRAQSIERFSAIVSIGPPHTAHLIGTRIAGKAGLPHIPVFIDPWVDIAYYRGMKRSAPTLALDNYLEKTVLRRSAASVFVTETLHEDYLTKYPFIKENSRVFHWGYNEDEFTGLTPSSNSAEKTIVHAGNIFDYQNPEPFFRYVSSRIAAGERLRFKFIGTVSPGIRASLQRAGLLPHTDFAGFLPYREMLQALMDADYLMVCATEKRHVPGKLFEYLRTGKPVVAFGEDNTEVDGILRSCNAGMLLPYSSSGEAFFAAAAGFGATATEAARYDRRAMAASVAALLQQVSQKQQ